VDLEDARGAMFCSSPLVLDRLGGGDVLRSGEAARFLLAGLRGAVFSAGAGFEGGLVDAAREDLLGGMTVRGTLEERPKRWWWMENKKVAALCKPVCQHRRDSVT
jgi:hypothetical protein